MTKKALGLVLLLGLAALPAWAGVVFEVETKDHGSETTQSDEVVVEGKNQKMGISGRGHKASGEVIYRGDRREMVVVDDANRSYMVIDEEAIASIAGAVQSSMGAMAAALENVPESQRRQIEEMMKKRMPQQAAGMGRLAVELRKTGEHGTHAGYPCVKYDVLRGGKKVRELWVADWSRVEGGGEVREAFREMGAFFEEMMDALSDATGMPPGLADSAFEHMKAIDGFPVVTREFDDDGSLESETTLRGTSRRKLDPADFDPPAGYKRRAMMN